MTKLQISAFYVHNVLAINVDALQLVVEDGRRVATDELMSHLWTVQRGRKPTTSYGC
jgi:hypothetical protein